MLERSRRASPVTSSGAQPSWPRVYSPRTDFQMSISEAKSEAALLIMHDRSASSVEETKQLRNWNPIELV